MFLLFLRFCGTEVADVLLPALSSSSLGSVFISGFFSSVSIVSSFGTTASGSSFFTRGSLVSSSCQINTTMVTKLQSWVQNAKALLWLQNQVKFTLRDINGGSLASGLIYGWQVSLLSPASTVPLWPIDYKMILSNCQHTSIFISVCFFPKLPSSSSSFTWGLASVVLMSGRACWELSSATEAGVGTLLSILAAAWDNFEEKGRNHNADDLLRIAHWLNFCVLRIDFQWHSPKAWCYFLFRYWSSSLPCMHMTLWLMSKVMQHLFLGRLVCIH